MFRRTTIIKSTRVFTCCFWLLMIPLVSIGSSYSIVDSLLQVLPEKEKINARVDLLQNLASTYLPEQPRKAVPYLMESAAIADSLQNKPGLLKAYLLLAKSYEEQKNYPRAYQFLQSYVESSRGGTISPITEGAGATQKNQSLPPAQPEISRPEDMDYNMVNGFPISDGQPGNTISGEEFTNYFLLSSLLFIMGLVIVLFRITNQKQFANKKLELQNEEIAKQKEEIEMQKRSIERKNSELERKNHELDETNKEKDYLIGIVAHDLKSPLNQIMGLVNLIRLEGGENLLPNQAKCLDKIESSSKRLSGMINKILETKAIEASVSNLHLEETEISGLARNVTDDFRNMAMRKNISIECETPPGSYNCVVDRGFTQQILENLISNAIKFSPTNKHVRVFVRESDDTVVIGVQDQGPGFTDQDKKKLFGKFQRLTAKPTDSEGSTGLGLSIVKKYVDAMDGKVWVQSKKEQGATFFVEFKKANNSQPVLNP
ncbi:sensor histidine kinase [Roseivirga sp. BDSF3-8]|uniref:sensor histidine kinase n=1 Tax=Roseivirga sp. BDSF3-8 TaxID=3241598 RepID=UPI003531C8C5